MGLSLAISWCKPTSQQRASVALIWGEQFCPTPVPLNHRTLGQESYLVLLFGDKGKVQYSENRINPGVPTVARCAVQVGLLTVYDMYKALDRGKVISDVRLLEKHGGKSGDWVADQS